MFYVLELLGRGSTSITLKCYEHTQAKIVFKREGEKNIYRGVLPK